MCRRCSINNGYGTVNVGECSFCWIDAEGLQPGQSILGAYPSHLGDGSARHLLLAVGRIIRLQNAEL